MKENFPNLGKELDMQVQEDQTIPNKLDSRRNTLRHIVIKLSKIKKKKNGTNERTDQSSRKNSTKQQRDSQPIRCTVQNTGNQL